MKLSKEDLGTPFDIINLPSQGLFYSSKKSSVLVKNLTAREEILLTSYMLNETGGSIKIMLESVIIDDDIEVDNLLVDDKNALLLYLRSTSYGDKYQVSINCPSCNKTGETAFNLSDMQIKDIEEFPDENGEFEYKLPKMKFQGETVTIKFKPLTVKDEMELIQEIKEKEDLGKKESITLKYKKQITSINGISDKDFISKIIKNFPIADSLAFRTYLEKIMPGIDNKVLLECPECQHKFTEEFNIGNNFFGFTPGYRENVWEEVFLGYYYGKGLSREDLYNMSTIERRWTIDRISKEIDAKNKAEEKAAKKANKGR